MEYIPPKPKPKVVDPTQPASTPDYVQISFGQSTKQQADINVDNLFLLISRQPQSMQE